MSLEIVSLSSLRSNCFIYLFSFNKLVSATSLPNIVIVSFDACNSDNDAFDYKIRAADAIARVGEIYPSPLRPRNTLREFQPMLQYSCFTSIDKFEER